MTVNKNVCEVCGSSNGYCNECGHMCGWRGNNILRWILGILIITWVFCIGMKFGQLTVFLDQAGYGRGNHMFFKASSMPMMSPSWTEGAPASFTISTDGKSGFGEAGVVKVIQAE